MNDENHFETHRTRFRPVLEELLLESNTRVGIKHAQIHLNEIGVNGDPTGVAEVYPTLLETYLRDPATHLSDWRISRDARFHGDGRNEFIDSQTAIQVYDHEFTRFFEHERAHDTLLQMREQNPNVFRTAALESELQGPFLVPDADISFFVDMVTNFAGLFEGLPVGDAFFLLHFYRTDPHGVLFWS